MQNTSECFCDEDIANGVLESYEPEAPRASSSTSFWVYKTRNRDVQWAVRVPPFEIADHEKRCFEVSKHFARYCLPYLVYSCFIPKGILVARKWYPVIKMEWVDGTDLRSWALQNLENTNELLRMASQWRGMMASLRGAQVAHGNLVPRNIVVTPQNRLVLVDHDNVCVPSIERLPAIKPPHPDWNHPKRTGERIDLDADQFPALVGYLTLLAAAMMPEFFRNHQSADRLLFCADDFAAPDKSRTMNALARSKTKCIRDLAACLTQWCKAKRYAQSFEDVIARIGLPVPNLHPVLLQVAAEPVAATEFLQPTPEEPDPAFDEPLDGDRPQRKSGLVSRLRGWPALVALGVVIAFLAVVFGTGGSYSGPDCEWVVFDLQPSPPQPYTAFEIQDPKSKQWYHRSAGDSRICLPPGEYGYRFVDENGKYFGERGTGFTVEKR